MPANDVHSVLLRALFDPQFHNQLTTNPDAALAPYNLTDAEKAVLKKPTTELYQYINPAQVAKAPSGIFGISGGDGGTPPPPPPPTTVTVIIVVAIVAFVTAVAPLTQSPANLARFQTLVNSIRNSTGAARYDLIKTLVNEMSTGQ